MTKRGRKKCTGCRDSPYPGIRRPPAIPGCRIKDIDRRTGHGARGWMVIERCDSCGAYESDEQAARAICPAVRIVRCPHRGTHVLGRLRRIREEVNCERKR